MSKKVKNTNPLHSFSEKDIAALDADRKILLLVEQDPDVRNLLKKACHQLLTFDVTIVEAINGVDAAAKIFGGLRPNVVVTDVSMSLLSGFELLNFIKTYPDEGIAQVPVIVMNGLGTEKPNVSVRSFQFFTKPFQVDEFCTAVENSFMQAEQQTSSAKGMSSWPERKPGNDFDA